MKTLEEIKDEYAKGLDYGVFKNWKEYRDFNEIHEEDLHVIAKRLAKEVANQALINASEKAQEMRYYVDDEVEADILGFQHRVTQACYAVPKQVILHESNIPNL